MTKIIYKRRYRGEKCDILTPYNKCPHCSTYSLVTYIIYNTKMKPWGTYYRTDEKRRYKKCIHCEYEEDL